MNVDDLGRRTAASVVSVVAEIIDDSPPGTECEMANVCEVYAGTLGFVAAALVTATAIAPPSRAEPEEPPVASSRDAVFIQDLNQIGVPYPSEPAAIDAAKNACAVIAEGHSIKEAVEGVRAANQAMSVLQGAHFVFVARTIYCPGHRSPH